MKHISFIALLVAFASCGSGGGSLSRDYKLQEAPRKLEPFVPVRVTVPKAWAESVGNMGEPTFEPAGKDTMFPSMSVLVVGCPEASTGAECIDKRIALETKDSTIERKQQGQATWIIEHNPKNGGGIDERLVFDAPSGDLVKCVLMYSKDDDVAAMRAACDAIVLRPSSP